MLTEHSRHHLNYICFFLFFPLTIIIICVFSSFVMGIFILCSSMDD
jgi:hypothetical protein